MVYIFGVWYKLVDVVFCYFIGLKILEMLILLDDIVIISDLFILFFFDLY